MRGQNRSCSLGAASTAQHTPAGATEQQHAARTRLRHALVLNHALDGARVSEHRPRHHFRPSRSAACAMAPRRRVYAEMRTDEYGNTPDVRFLPHLARRVRGGPSLPPSPVYHRRCCAVQA